MRALRSTSSRRYTDAIRSKSSGRRGACGIECATPALIAGRPGGRLPLWQSIEWLAPATALIVIVGFLSTRPRHHEHRSLESSLQNWPSELTSNRFKESLRSTFAQSRSRHSMNGLRRSRPFFLRCQRRRQPLARSGRTGRKALDLYKSAATGQLSSRIGWKPPSCTGLMRLRLLQA